MFGLDFKEKTKRKLAGVLLSSFLATLAVQNPAVANSFSFNEGKSVGNAKKNEIANSTKSYSQDMPNFGLSSTDTSQIQNMFSKGKDSADSVVNIKQEGYNTSLQACTDDDYACQGREVTTTKNTAYTHDLYLSALELSPRIEGLNAANPDDVLGLSGASEGGTVCEEESVTLGERWEEQTCVNTSFKQILHFDILPVNNAYEYAQPHCFDPEMTLSGDMSVCSKQEYQCPVGSSIDGTTCTELSDEIWDYTGPARCDNLSSSTYTVGYKRSRNTMTFKCQNDKMLLTSRGAGSDGGGIVEGDFWGEIDPNITYNNKPIVPVAGDWSGRQRQGVVTATGECKDGQCSYNFIMGRSGTTWARATGFYCTSGTLYSDDFGLNARCRQSNGTYTEAKLSCPSGYVPENSPYRDSARGAYVSMCGKMGSLGGRWNVESNFGTHTMPDPRDQGWTCPKGFSSNGSGCVKKFPATLETVTAQPGCLGEEVISAGQVVQSSPEFVDGTESGGVKTCRTELYSCPEGMAMNGKKCEDPSKYQYADDPNCKYLQQESNPNKEGYLCTNRILKECEAISGDCYEKENKCINTDDVEGSPSFGQCVAREYTMMCKKGGEAVTKTTCSFKPACINGDCFEQEEKCSGSKTAVYENKTESCEVLRQEEIRECPVTFKYSEPDEDGDTHIIGGEVDEATCAHTQDNTCEMLPYRQQLEDGGDGVSFWPENASFSCITSELNLCEKLESDESCSFRSQSDTHTSGTGVALATKKSFTCQRETVDMSNECVSDFAMVTAGIEAGRQAGNYVNPETNKIFSGEFHRCDRRKAAFAGASFGSKSCCNISAPDAESNSQVVGNLKTEVAKGALMYGAEYAYSTASPYVYDYVMDNKMFQDVASSIFSEQTMQTMNQNSGMTLTDPSFSVGAYGLSVSYTGTALSAGTSIGTTSSGFMSAGSSSWSLGGGFQFNFSPVGLGIAVAVQLYSMYQAALACDTEDYQTATLSRTGLCYTTGSWCAKKDCGFLGCTCVKYRTGKCCFNSKLARIINEQGRKQLGLSKTDCGGFTAEQLQQLDWSQIDMSEFVADMVKEAQSSIPSPDQIEALTDRVRNSVGRQNAISQAEE